ncbi:nuclear transport factor 2 family protein [Sphingomonas sp. 1P06PA]|uniref:nuclear transport factor 2 family protein n=1 Tax=Sphingomonas sp. 1P06PA TaxID=554121 RepID=UPI0039A597A7
MVSLELRIDRLEARAEIAELCSAYGIACDEHDYDRLESLFTEDVVIQSRDRLMDASGREAVMAMFGRMLAIRGPAYHWTHDRFVRFDDADADIASGLVLAHAETSPDGVASIAAIRYADRYRREAGCWKFAERQLSFLYYMPITEFAARFPTADRMGLGGNWRGADFPEGLPTFRRQRP